LPGDAYRFQGASFGVHGERASGRLGAREALSLFATDRRTPLYVTRCSFEALLPQATRPRLSWRRRAGSVQQAGKAECRSQAASSAARTRAPECVSPPEKLASPTDRPRKQRNDSNVSWNRECPSGQLSSEGASNSRGSSAFARHPASRKTPFGNDARWCYRVNAKKRQTASRRIPKFIFTVGEKKFCGHKL
jgi:hypothetical protein